MSDGPDRGRSEPRQAEQRADGTEDDDEQEVQVETRAFDEATLLFTDDQSEGVKRNGNSNKTNAREFIGVFAVLLKTYEVICVSMKMRMNTRSAGTTEAPIIQVGKGCLSPNGLISQLLFSGDVTEKPEGTLSF